MKKTYVKPTVSRFAIRPEDSVVAACKMVGPVQLPSCQPGGVQEFAAGSSYVNYLLQIGSWYPANVLRWPARHKPSRRLAQGGVKGGEAVSRSEIGDP